MVLDRDVDTDAGAGVALVGQPRQSASRVRIERGQHQFAGGGQVVGRAGTDLGDPQRKAGRVKDDLHVPAEGGVLAGVSQVVPALGAGGDPVGRDEGAVQADEGQPGGVGAVQDVVAPGRVRDDHVECFVQIAVGGGDAQAGLAGQMRKSSRWRSQRRARATWACTVPARCVGRDPGRRRCRAIQPVTAFRTEADTSRLAR
jgi:hypothetical protein